MEKQAIKKLKPTDKVLSCKYIESGIRFLSEGVVCCCANTLQSPVIITEEEMRSGKVNYDLVVERRKELFEALNGLNNHNPGSCAICNVKYETEYKNVNFENLGGHGMPSGFNIQHFTLCNFKCKYCCLAQSNDCEPPRYDNIIEFIEEFRTRNKLVRGEWIEYNGGEPTLLKDFEKILNYLLKYDIGNIGMFSNSSIFSEAIYNGLKENKITLMTSLDAGTPSTFKMLRGVDAFQTVIQNLIRYKKSGTNKLWIKYILCDENMNEDDLFGFIFAMIAIKPNKVYIAPKFPYGDTQIPQKAVDFGARMWYLMEKYAGVSPYIQTDDNTADCKFINFSKDIRECYAKLKCEKDFGNEWNLNYNPTNGFINADCCCNSSKGSDLKVKIKKILARIFKSKRRNFK